jgi:hypothetical protein
MSTEAATLRISKWQNVMSILASLCSCHRAQPHSERARERQVDRLFNAWKDEPPEVKRFIASQMERGFWI